MPHTAPIAVAAPAPVLPVRWQPDRTMPSPKWPLPGMPQALLRGFKGACPSCGKSHIFNGYLRVVKECTNCGAPLGSIRADDVPPYATIFVVGHIVVPLMLVLEKTEAPPLWVHTVLWVPLTLVLTLGLLRPIKGAVVGLMFQLGMLGAQPESLGGDA